MPYLDSNVFIYPVTTPRAPTNKVTGTPVYYEHTRARGINNQDSPGFTILTAQRAHLK